MKRTSSSVNSLEDRRREHEQIYLAIERSLWALGPALLLLIALGYPSQQAARQQIAVDRSIEVAAENAEYCAKWGMAAGSAQHGSCLRDLTGIRARTELRARDEAALDF
jgi:Arc/MetJ family transcription regulator